MKRFLLFICATYYPSGGFQDFFGSYDTLEEATADADGGNEYLEHWHVIDTQAWAVAASDTGDTGPLLEALSLRDGAHVP